MSPDSFSRTPRAVFLSVALLSAAVLGYEVALSRVFSTLLRYQFAFLVISLALCGLGLGGLLAARRPQMSLARLALGWGLSAVIGLGLILRGVFALMPQHYWIAALLVLVPFTLAGAFLALAFERYKQDGGRLYGVDLMGAALAAFACVAVMQFFGAINACLLFAAMGASGAVLLEKKRGFALALSAVLLAFVPLNAHFKLLDVPAIPPMRDAAGLSLAERGITQPLYTELGEGKAGSKVVDSRWNAFARTDVVVDPVAPDSYLLYTNGNVPTNMLRWNGQLASIPLITRDFPLSHWTFENANVRGKTVLSIGPGGGLDALLSLVYGARNFEGAEINPSIVGLMNEPFYAKFNGGIYQQPHVRVQTAEGRAFVREGAANGQRYGLIFSALTKTATAGQGAALLESFIYTSDAFNDYLDALESNGQVAIVGDAIPLLARLYATGIAHFEQKQRLDGLSPRAGVAGSHLAIVFYGQPGPYQWALVAQKTPFSAQQTARMEQSARRLNLVPLWIPGRAQNDELFPFGSLGSGVLTFDGFLKSGRDNPQVALDLRPCPDDRPFVLDLAFSPFAIFQSSPSLTVLLALSVLGTFGFAGTLLSARSGTGGRGVIYFLSLGIGFMLVEIPLIQKLALVLGYPTLSLTVVLFSILLGAGAGALFSQRYAGPKLRQHALGCTLGVAIFSIVLSLSLGVISDWLLPFTLVARCAMVALLLLPLGFLLGTPFPAGLRLLAREGNVPLIWALNGTASVVGSIGAVVLAKVFGFSTVVTWGALIYILAAGLLAMGKDGDSTFGR